MSYHLVWSDPFHERQSYRDHSEKCVPSLPDRPWDCISHLLYPYSNMCPVLWYLLGSHLLFFGSQKYAASSIWNEFLLAFYIGRILEEKSFVSGMRDVGGLLFTEAFFTVTACCYRNKGQKKKSSTTSAISVINFEALDDRPRKAMWGFSVPVYFWVVWASNCNKYLFLLKMTSFSDTN